MPPIVVFLAIVRSHVGITVRCLGVRQDTIVTPDALEILGSPMAWTTRTGSALHLWAVQTTATAPTNILKLAHARQTFNSAYSFWMIYSGTNTNGIPQCHTSMVHVG